jgi:integrase
MWSKVQDAVNKLQEKLPRKERVDLSDVTLHDLRRSFASLGARLGYPEAFTGALLGHSAGTVTQGYARLGFDPLRDAVEVIGARMAALLAGTVDLDSEVKATKKGAAARRAAKGA